MADLKQAKVELRTALELLESGMPNVAGDWAKMAAETIAAANDERRANIKHAIQKRKGQGL